MSKVYAVCWGRASVNAEGNGDAFCNIHGVYWNLPDAQRGLEELRTKFVDEIVNDPELDEDDQAIARNYLRIYGSVKEGYFELDNNVCDVIEEIYLTIAETELN